VKAAPVLASAVLAVAAASRGPGTPAAPRAAPQAQSRTASFELRGPLARAEWALRAGAARTVLSAELRAGEVRRLELPFAGGALADLPPELVRLEPPGARATFDAWRPAPSLDLPAGLTARPRPPVGRARPALSGAASALLLAAGVLAFAARRRAAACLAAGLAGAGGVALLTLSREPPRAAERVLEGDASGRWMEVEAAFERLDVPAGDVRGVEFEPAAAAAAPVVWTVELDPRGERWSAERRGARICRLSRFDPRARRLERELNAWGALEAAWTRAAVGSWSYHGAWPLGTALPPQQGGRGAPGWLAAGLPQGVGVLIARWRHAEGAETTWIRLVGF